MTSHAGKYNTYLEIGLFVCAAAKLTLALWLRVCVHQIISTLGYHGEYLLFASTLVPNI